ncbi:unnamed protein product [Vitrella brassicaformis CCMP3155]|uniref:LNR domain-containing protein n=1 Tax=Vitrella brassicaformis (strain CCMP3155) TaxID=1169540 RepID=A0A0G4GLL7_VITBC|nr:unnamed protein product [Vitrella brassicaformis CCMP3155]|eukprot:CEM31013.1 unnamed protein product [Vitrella brassicaformis CCMP3155]
MSRLVLFSVVVCGIAVLGLLVVCMPGRQARRGGGSSHMRKITQRRRRLQAPASPIPSGCFGDCRDLKWFNDTVCDFECYNYECEFDGGDCEPGLECTGLAAYCKWNETCQSQDDGFGRCESLCSTIECSEEENEVCEVQRIPEGERGAGSGVGKCVCAENYVRGDNDECFQGRYQPSSALDPVQDPADPPVQDPAQLPPQDPAQLPPVQDPADPPVQDPADPPAPAAQLGVETCEPDECAARTVLFSLTGCVCIERSCQKEGADIPGLERFCTVLQEDCDKGPCKCLGPTFGQYYDACVEGGIEQVFTNGGCRCTNECRKRSSDDKPACRIHSKEDCADQSASGSYRLPECDSPAWAYQLRPPTFCTGVAERLGSMRKAHWTHLVYMNADNNLEGYAMSDLKEMLQIPKSDINLLVLVDRADPEVDDSSHRAIHQMVICPEATPEVNAREVRQQFSGAYELLMIGDPYENENSTSRRRWLLKRDWGESNMDDGKVLRDFIADALKDFPAEHYALTFWDHGVGRKGFGGDSSHGNWDSLMNLWALETNIRNGVKDAGMPEDFRFDLLSFDACLMASYEVTTALASHGHFFLGSETLISGAGWDWTSLRPTQPNGQATPPFEYAKKIAMATMDYYVRNQRLMTLAIVDLYKILDFRGSFSQSQKTLTKRLHDCVGTKEVDRIRTATRKATDDSLRGRQLSLFSREIANPVDMGSLLRFVEAEVERVIPADELEIFSFKDAYKKYNESVVYFNGSDNFGNIPLTGLHADLTLEGEEAVFRLLRADDETTSGSSASDARRLQDDTAKWGAAITDDPNWQRTGTPNDLRVFLEPIYDSKRNVCRGKRGSPGSEPKFMMLNCTLYLMSSAEEEADSTTAAPRYRIEVFRNTSSGAASYTALKTIMTKPKTEDNAKSQQAFVVAAEESPRTDELEDYVIDHVTAEWEGESWILHQNVWKGIQKVMIRDDCDVPLWIRQCPAAFGDAVPPRSGPAINEGSDRTFNRQCVWLSALAPTQSNGATLRTLQIPARLYRTFTDFLRDVKDARPATLVIDYDVKSPHKSRLSLFAANRFGVEAEVSSRNWGLIEPLHTYVNLTAVDGLGRYDMASDASIHLDVPSCAAFMWGSDSQVEEPEADMIEVLQWPPVGSATPGQAEEAEDGASPRALQHTNDNNHERVLGIKAKETLANPKVIGSFVALSEANSEQRTNTGCPEFEKDRAGYCKMCDALVLLGEGGPMKEFVGRRHGV